MLKYYLISLLIVLSFSSEGQVLLELGTGVQDSKRVKGEIGIEGRLTPTVR